MTTLCLQEELDTHGVAVVRSLVSRRDAHHLSGAFNQLLDLARTLPATSELGGSQFVIERGVEQEFRLKRVVWCGGASPSLGRYGSDRRVLELAALALGRPDVTQIIQQAHFKLPGDGVDFAWHQDASNRRYGSELWTDLDGRGSFVQIALAVDPMGPGNGGLEFIRGSHRLGFVANPQTGVIAPGTFDPNDKWVPHLEPGDAVVFGPFVIHGSGPNLSRDSRRLFLQGFATPGANRRIYPGCGTGVARRYRP